MKHILIFTLASLLLIASTSCSGKKAPEQTAVKSKNVLAALRDLSRAYEKKDLAAFMSGVAPAHKDRDALAKSVGEVFAKYETIHFNIQYTRMLIMVEEKGATKAAFNWDGEWIATGGALLKNGGRVTLVFEPGSVKLVSIDGKNPFVPQPGEMPGKQ
jgi:hypothetical protein